MAQQFTGSVSLNKNGYAFYINVTETAYNVAENTSSVQVDVYLQHKGWGWIDGRSFPVSCSVNGEEKTASYTSNVAAGSSVTKKIATFTFDNIVHNDDGSKIVAVSASLSASGTYSPGYCSATGSFALTTIARLATLAVENGTLGQAQTLTISYPDNSYQTALYYYCGNSPAEKIYGPTHTESVEWTPPLSLGAQNPTGYSVTITFILRTYSGGRTEPIGEKQYTATYSIPLKAPDCTFEVSDTAGLDGIYGGYVQGISKLNVKVIPVAYNGAKISSYSAIVNNAVYKEYDFVTGVLEKSGSNDIEVMLFDSRNRFNTISYSFNVLEYTRPAITSLSVHRCDADGTANDKGEYTNIVFSGEVTPLNNANKAVYTLYYKKTHDTEYSSLVILEGVYSAVNRSYVLATNSAFSYDIKLVLEDDFNNFPKETSVSTGSVFAEINVKMNGAALGKRVEIENFFEVDLETGFRKPVSFDLPILEGAATNLNKTCGVFLAAGSAENPAGVDGWLFHLQNKDDVNTAKQVFLPVETQQVYERTKTGGTWDAFKTSPCLTESGTSGIWHYEKWSNGRAQIVGKLPVNGTNITTAMGALYRNSGAYTKENYKFPFSFIEKPVCQMVYNSTNGMGAWVWPTAECYIDMLPDIYLVRHNSVSGSIGVIDIIVEGKWK